jgi:hypothetical protein
LREVLALNPSRLFMLTGTIVPTRRLGNCAVLVGVTKAHEKLKEMLALNPLKLSVLTGYQESSNAQQYRK